MKYTSGPWKHIGSGDIQGTEDNGNGIGPVDVCSVYLRTVKGRTEANAALIAAAPELYESLSWLMNQVPQPIMQGDYAKGNYATGYLAAKLALHKAINGEKA